MIARAERISRLYDGLRAADTIVAKTLRVHPLAQAARIEVKLRQYISAQWDDLADQAAKTAASMFRRGKGDISDAEIERVMHPVDRTMAQWAPRIEKRYTDDLRETYGLANIAALNKALGHTKGKLRYSTREWDTGTVIKAAPVGAPIIEPVFNLADRKAMDALEDHQIFWVGEHYSENVSDHIAKTARTHIIEQGRGRVVAGREMEKVIRTALKEVRVPEGFIGTSERYFEGLVANAATTARSISSVNAFRRTGFTIGVWTGAADHRQCSKCTQLDGMEFPLDAAADQAQRLFAAKSPKSVKRIQPWFKAQQIRDIKAGKGPKGGKGSDGLVRHGVIQPPAHLKCRCNMDISEKEELIPLL